MYLQIYIVFTFIFLLFFRPPSLSGCPIAAAEKLSKGQDKPHLSQPGSELLKGCPNDRVLRLVINKTAIIYVQHMNEVFFLQLNLITFDKYGATIATKDNKMLSDW